MLTLEAKYFELIRKKTFVIHENSEIDRQHFRAVFLSLVDTCLLKPCPLFLDPEAKRVVTGKYENIETRPPCKKKNVKKNIKKYTIKRRLHSVIYQAICSYVQRKDWK